MVWLETEGNERNVEEWSECFHDTAETITAALTFGYTPIYSKSALDSTLQ